MSVAKYYHHQKNIFKKKRRHSPRRKKVISFMDQIIWCGGVLVPLTLLPQLLKIWIYKTADGVSLISWIAFTGGAVFWLTYGILHKAKPIIFMYTIMILLEIIIVIGVLLYG